MSEKMKVLSLALMLGLCSIQGVYANEPTTLASVEKSNKAGFQVYQFGNYKIVALLDGQIQLAG